MPSRDDFATPARRTAALACFLALACVLGLVESMMLPPLPLPGLRLGLANIAVVVALAAMGPADALAVTLGRVIIVGFATGSLLGPVGAMSAAGALASWATMAVLVPAGARFSPIGWSLGGSAAHVVAQLVVAAVAVASPSPLMLLPISLGLSLPSGLAVGLVARLLLSRISREVVPVLA